MKRAAKPNCEGDGALVSVIVPAWNAEATLAQTLRSAGAQTHRDLEILIVDDGSTDGTSDIAEVFCAADSRGRLIRKTNGGLASARNCGIDCARGAWIAPLDADDLWHPRKIERQLATFAAGSDRTGLVYCWYRVIDDAGTVIEPLWAPVVEGDVFARHLKLNFGTGSSPLIRRSALGQLRYDEELSRPEAGGCEDWLLQLQIAAGHDVACTKDFLVDYRARSGSMSADKRRMAKAHVHMYEIIERSFPGRSSSIVRRELARWRAIEAVMEVQDRASRKAIGRLAGAFALAPLTVAGTILRGR